MWFQGCMKWPGCAGTRNEKGESSMVSAVRQTRMWSFLKAAIKNSEDECLTFTEAQLEEVENFELHLDEVTEARAYIMTIRQKTPV